MTIPQAPMAKNIVGCALLDQVRSEFQRYTIQASPHEYVALTLYVAYTHAAYAFDFAPRLLITSAEKRSGKTRTLEIVSALCCKPLMTANASVSAVFRSIDPENPRTIIMDEADTIFGSGAKSEKSEDLRGLINAGFQRGMPILRSEGTNTQFKVREFPSFAPVVVAAIGELPDTVTDRAVNIRIRRKKPDETVAEYRVSRHGEALHVLRDDLSSWISQHLDALAEMRPATPLKDRAADLWEPLLAVADLAGGDWPKRARHAALYFAKQAAEADTESSLGIELLRDIDHYLADLNADFIPSLQLISGLCFTEDARWQEMELSPRKLAQLLKPYDVHPASNGQMRGYKVARLRSACERWLSPPPASVADSGESRNEEEE